MIRRLAVLHTVRTLADRFHGALREAHPGLDHFHMLDESLLQDLIRHGPSTNVTRRAVSFAQQAADAGADLILFTCSSTSPAVDVARATVATPILKIDDPLMAAAVRAGRRIGLLCTASSTAVPSEALMRAHAAELGIEPEIQVSLVAPAFEALSAGDRGRHDALLRQVAATLAPGVDVIVLAQASMAHLQEELGALTGRPVLASFPLAMAEIGRRMAA
ncbi:aspartate/glutamate racemase family protein [Muricoccus radiodurans]|uniref:aspartate/glutamate racemase family protein n=1 Tax=Muricoccus radiodurans TaxID=2231721 RepID=UPI003CEFB370